MTTCAACGRRATKMRTAIILRGPKSAKRGRVCRECAALGWLFVLGSDLEGRARPAAEKPARAPRRSSTVLEKYGFGLREVPRKKSAIETPAIELPAGELRTLTALVQYGRLTRDALSVVTNYKKSTRDLNVRKLAARNLVGIDSDGVFPLDDARDALGSSYEPLPTGRDLREHWLNTLPAGERAILAYLTRANTPILASRDEVGEQTGYKKSTRDLNLRKLAARKLVRVEGAGIVAARELFG